MENCVYDCLISTSHKNIKIQNAAYGITKVIYYKLDGSKEVITDLETIKDFMIAVIDFSILGVVGEHGEYALQDLADDIPIVGYRASAHCAASSITPEELQEYNAHEEWFAHQSGEISSPQSRIYRKWMPYDSYLYNPISPWIEKFTDYTKSYLETHAGYDGVFLDDTSGWVNPSLYVWHKYNEVQSIKSGIDENGDPFKYLSTDYPIYTYENFSAIVSSLTEPNLMDYNKGIWGEMHRIYFDYSMPVDVGTAVNVSYYTAATIPPEILNDNWWKQQMIEVLDKTKEKNGGKLIIYNGFDLTKDYDNDFLQKADGGMLEGFVHNGWTSISENITESYWKQQVEKLSDISDGEKKIFLAQTNALIDEEIDENTTETTEAQIQKLAMFSFASFLLGKGDYAYYGFNVFKGAGASNQFIYFDYWGTDIGKPLEKYHLMETPPSNVTMAPLPSLAGLDLMTSGFDLMTTIYERRFKNVLVLVNPSEITATVNLGGSYKTLTGDEVSSFEMVPKSGVILFPDSDNDGISDYQDNCPHKPNGPYLGTCSASSDKPGVNCTSDADCVNGCSTNGLCIKDQRDIDGDNIGDVCDFCDSNGANDTDNDGYCDLEDNCPTVCNPQQLDADKDGIGDVCDTDPGCGGCTGIQCEQQC